MLEQLVKFLEELEGFKASIYKDTAGVDTIGIGTLWNSEIPMTITHQEAVDYCLADCKKRNKQLDTICHVLLNDNQRIAILSFMYNEGFSALSKSTLLKLINQNKFIKAAEEFLKWDKEHENGILVVNKGLHNRRIKERSKFLEST